MMPPFVGSSAEDYRSGVRMARSTVSAFVEDATERKEADIRLAEAERMASIGELSAGVAHEINNPLTSIVLYSRMLLDEEIPDSIRDNLQVVSSQA